MNAYNLINSETPLIDVVARAQRGERAAFGELFVRFEKHVYAIALRRLIRRGAEHPCHTRSPGVASPSWRSSPG